MRIRSSNPCIKSPSPLVINTFKTLSMKPLGRAWEKSLLVVTGMGKTTAYLLVFLLSLSVVYGFELGFGKLVILL